MSPLFIFIFLNSFSVSNTICSDLPCARWPFVAVSLVIVNSSLGQTGMPSPSQVWIRLQLNRASF